MIDNPKPDLETVRNIVEQIAKGLRAFHRKEMLHQDLRPDNIMIDKTERRRSSISARPGSRASPKLRRPGGRDDILGTTQYTAPEYFLGEGGSPRSDMFSLGVIAYQMLTGKLPYGAQIAKARTRSQFGKLRYHSALDDNREIPAWIDGALRKAVHPDPGKRYESLSEFMFDLRHPNSKYLETSRQPLIERNPEPVLEMCDGHSCLRRDRATGEPLRDSSLDGTLEIEFVERNRPNRESLAVNASRRATDGRTERGSSRLIFTTTHFRFFSIASAARIHFPASRRSAAAVPTGIRIPGFPPRMALRPRSAGRPLSGAGLEGGRAGQRNPVWRV